MYVVLIAILTLGNGIISYYLVDFEKTKEIANISLFFTVYSFTLMIMKPFIGKLQDAKEIKVVLYPAFLLYTMGIVILAKSYSLFTVLIVAALKGLGQGNGAPTIQAESVKTISKECRGVAISTCFIGQDIGNALGAIFASSMVGVVGYESMFLIYVMILVVGLVLYFINNQYKSRKVI